MPDAFQRRSPTQPLPPIFSVRTSAPLLIALLVAAATTAASLPATYPTACLAWASVLVVQLLGPLCRELAKRTDGRLSRVLFALPFGLVFLPYALWGALVGPASTATPADHAWAVPVAVLVGLGVQATAWRDWKIGFDGDLLELMPPIGAGFVALQIWMLAASATLQEIFYRGVLPHLLAGLSPVLVVVLVGLAFVVEHVSNRWAVRTHGCGYYLRLGGLSLGLGVLAVLTGSLPAAVAGHLAFNAVPLAQTLVRWRLTRGLAESGSSSSSIFRRVN